MHRLRHVVIPIVGLALFAATLGAEPSTWLGIVLGVVLALCVLEAVHHAEVVAARVGEPFGSLILAVAVTVIEVGLIIALMLNDPDTTGGVARDTVFSATMIACNGIVGGALVLGTWRERLVTFNPEGVGAAVAAIAALAVLSLVLPTFTETTPGPYFSTTQLVFAAVAALAIYLAYVLVQTVRHRDFFLPPDALDTGDESHAESPSAREAWTSLALLAVSLVAVVGLAKATSPLVQNAADAAGLPQSAVAVSIALLVLLPESVAALRAARRRRIQTSLNLAYGSVMASIGLTIPVIAAISLAFGFDLALGLSTAEIALLALTVVVAALTVVPGRATLLQGVVHLAIFAAFLVFAVNP